ncbi:Uncharacterised protein [uncultured archaeon]|nr:Uncharacterised protein [uncultured archaeon]
MVLCMGQLRKISPIVAFGIFTLILFSVNGAGNEGQVGSPLKSVSGDLAELNITQVDPNSILVSNVGNFSVNLSAQIWDKNESYVLPVFDLKPGEKIQIDLGNGTMNQTKTDGVVFAEKSLEDRQKEKADEIITDMLIDGSDQESINAQKKANKELLGYEGDFNPDAP